MCRPFGGRLRPSQDPSEPCDKDANSFRAHSGFLNKRLKNVFLFSQLMVARFFVGVSVGMVNSALSMMAEVAPRATRGRSILVIPGTAFALGQVKGTTPLSFAL